MTDSARDSARNETGQQHDHLPESQKHDGASAFREQLDTWREQVDRLRAIAYAANASVQEEMNRLIAELDKRLLMANEKFLSYLEAGDDVIEAARSSAEELWDSLKAAVRETVSAASSETHGTATSESGKPASDKARPDARNGAHPPVQDAHTPAQGENAKKQSITTAPASPAEATTPNAGNSAGQSGRPPVINRGPEQEGSLQNARRPGDKHAAPTTVSSLALQKNREGDEEESVKKALGGKSSGTAGLAANGRSHNKEH